MNLHSLHLKFVTDTENLVFFFENVDIYCFYHQYYKKIKFYIRHLSNLMTIYFQISL